MQLYSSVYGVVHILVVSCREIAQHNLSVPPVVYASSWDEYIDDAFTTADSNNILPGFNTRSTQQVHSAYQRLADFVMNAQQIRVTINSYSRYWSRKDTIHGEIG